MKTLISSLVAVTLIFTASTALATEFTKGTVKKVDLKGKKVTIIHEELKNLEMPAMTMVFYPKEEAMLDRMKEGQVIEFVAGRINGKLTVIDFK